VKKPDRNRRADIAYIRAMSALDKVPKKPPSPETRERYDAFVAQLDCPEPMRGLIPIDIREAHIVRDFFLAKAKPRHFAMFAQRFGITIAEMRHERDRALQRLEAAAHKLHVVSHG
jgi:hypothetical protein